MLEAARVRGADLFLHLQVRASRVGHVDVDLVVAQAARQRTRVEDVSDAGLRVQEDLVLDGWGSAQVGKVDGLVRGGDLVGH